MLLALIGVALSISGASEVDNVPGWRFRGRDPEVRAASAMSAAKRAPTPVILPNDGWLPEATSYQFGRDEAIFHGGKSSASIWCKLGRCEDSASLMQTIRADEYVGRRVRLSAWVRAERAGKCGLWMRVSGGPGYRFGFDNTIYGSRGKTFEWRLHQIVLDVKPGATLISFGLVLSESGRAWIDDVRLEPVGTRVRTTDLSRGIPRGDPAMLLYSTQCPLLQPENLDFEQSASVREKGATLDPFSSGRLVFKDAEHQYRDPYLSLSFGLAPSWTVKETKDSQAAREVKSTVILYDAHNQLSAGVHYRVCIEPCRAGSNELDRALRARVDAEISHRTNVLFKGKDYHVRAGSCRERTINGNRAMTCVADYRTGKRAMAEYLTCVGSASAQVLFVAQVPTPDLDEIRRRLDPVIDSLRIP